MHIMLDLETLSTHNDAFIISIGAVRFNKKGIHESFLYAVELSDTTKFHVSPMTVGWWLGQVKDAKSALSRNVRPLVVVLENFRTFITIKDFSRSNDSNNLLQIKGMWGNGSTFDNVILRNAYRIEGITCPWHFRYDRCYRTLKYALPAEPFERIGTHHNPLDDAKSQALHLIKICNKNGIDLGE